MCDLCVSLAYIKRLKTGLALFVILHICKTYLINIHFRSAIVAGNVQLTASFVKTLVFAKFEALLWVSVLLWEETSSNHAASKEYGIAL